jgi:hypothetical protein
MAAAGWNLDGNPSSGSPRLQPRGSMCGDDRVDVAFGDDEVFSSISRSRRHVPSAVRLDGARQRTVASRRRLVVSMFRMP